MYSFDHLFISTQPEDSVEFLNHLNSFFLRIISFIITKVVFI